MNARTASRTFVIAAGLGCAGLPLQSWAHPQPSEATPPPGSPEAVKGKETDFVQAWVDLVERYQPQGGTDATAPNAHDSLVRLVVLVERVEQKVVKAAHGTPPDFTLVYSKREGEVPGDEASQERAAAVAMLEELDRSKFDALLTELVERVRAVTPRLDSPQRALELRAMGIRVTESAISDFIGARSPELLKARQVARINFARMHRAAAAGDWDRTVRSFEQSLALARVLSHEPSHLDRITAGAIASATLCEMRCHITERRPTDSVLAGIAAAMERQLRFPSMEFYSRGEKLMVLSMISAAFKQRGLKLNMSVDVEQPTENAKPSEPRKPGKATTLESLETINEYYALISKEVALARSERAPLAANRRTFEQERIVQRVALLESFIESVDQVMNVADQLELEIAGTRAMIAVERSQRATGTWPAALSDIAKESALSAMLDPWSSKMPVRYRRLDTPDEHGRNYLIYSVGVDGEDNHGKELDKDNRFDALNKPLTNGVDYVVNVPRE